MPAAGLTAMLSESFDVRSPATGTCAKSQYQESRARSAESLTRAVAFETSPRARRAPPAGALVPTAILPTPAPFPAADTVTAAFPPTSRPAAARDAVEVLPINRGFPAAADVDVDPAEFSSPNLAGAREARRGRAICREKENGSSVNV